MSDPFRDVTRRASAKRGVAAARGVLQIVRTGAVYTVDGKQFDSWADAIEHVLNQPSLEGDA